jgi:AcrR family transcriptional regulator
MKSNRRKPGPKPDPEKRQQMLEMLMEGHSPPEVAEAVGVHLATVYRFRSSEEFEQHVEQEESDLKAFLRKIDHDPRYIWKVAMEGLLSIMNDPRVHPRDRLKACKEILKSCLGEKARVSQVHSHWS